MNPKIKNLVAEFVLDSMPPAALDAYGIVAELKYPLTDKHSLSVNLDDLAKKLKSPATKENLAINLVRSAFDAADFPIQTPRSGLEKFYRKLTQNECDCLRPIGSEMKLDPRKFGFGDPTWSDPFEAYRNHLGEGHECAVACAVAHFNDRGGWSDPLAFFAGLSAGRECLRTGLCHGLPPQPGRPFRDPLFSCRPRRREFDPPGLPPPPPWPGI